MEEFLIAVDETFPVPLSKKQNLSDYAHKLYEKATICAALENERIVSLAAGYTENLADDSAYLAILATLPCARGKGLAAKLVKEFMQVCVDKGIRSMHLYAVSTNTPAMNLYYSLGFKNLQLADEPRKDDAHLIYYFGDNKQ